MSDDILARLLLRQATLTTARCASLVHCEYLAGASIADLAEPTTGQLVGKPRQLINRAPPYILENPTRLKVNAPGDD